MQCSTAKGTRDARSTTHTILKNISGEKARLVGKKLAAAIEEHLGWDPKNDNLPIEQKQTVNMLFIGACIECRIIERTIRSMVWFKNSGNLSYITALKGLSHMNAFPFYRDAVQKIIQVADVHHIVNEQEDVLAYPSRAKLLELTRIAEQINGAADGSAVERNRSQDTFNARMMTALYLSFRTKACATRIMNEFGKERTALSHHKRAHATYLKYDRGYAHNWRTFEEAADKFMNYQHPAQ